MNEGGEEGKGGEIELGNEKNGRRGRRFAKEIFFLKISINSD